jgi:1-acyl-sn-glycerol-3-phosphate acyltransferase
MGFLLSTIWKGLKFVRAAVILYLVLTNVVSIVGIFSVAGILSLPFGGFRLARKNMQRFPGMYLNTITALIAYFLLDTHVIVYVDEAEIKRDLRQSESTISCICKRFGLNGGKIEEIAVDESRDIVIANHQIYADWIYIWGFLGLLGRAGNIKIVCKRAIQFIPVIGWVRGPLLFMRMTLL